MTPSKQVPSIVEDDRAEKVLKELLETVDADLEALSPERALELYLEDKQREYQQATVNSHRSRLGFFIEWCREEGIDNLNELSARDLHEYRVWRREDLNLVSEKTQMDTLRVFIEWCERIDAVPAGLALKIESPTIPDGENARDTMLHADRARDILEYLSTYEYASTEHVLWAILAHTGIRMGAAHALDVQDYHPDAESPNLEIVHRPETETPIKNKAAGERHVAISDDLCDVLDDYLQQQRFDVPDDHGREPLLTTRHGRLSKTTIRKYVYKWSRPCEITGECSHDRDIEGCEAAGSINQSSKCPSSVTPHPIRRGYITHALRSGIPLPVVSERCNVSPAVIEEHYDVRSEQDKMRQRSEILDETQEDGSSYA